MAVAKITDNFDRALNPHPNPGWPLFRKTWNTGKVRELKSGQGKVRENRKNQGKVRENEFLQLLCCREYCSAKVSQIHNNSLLRPT